MKYFFGCTFMSREELTTMGVQYPIKLEYYKTEVNAENNRRKMEAKYGIEIIKTSYKEPMVEIEKKAIPEMIKDEKTVEIILEKLKKNKVTPVAATYIIEDLLKAEC